MKDPFSLGSRRLGKRKKKVKLFRGTVKDLINLPGNTNLQRDMFRKACHSFRQLYRCFTFDKNKGVHGDRLFARIPFQTVF
jgi:hypothetical protein